MQVSTTQIRLPWSWENMKEELNLFVSFFKDIVVVCFTPYMKTEDRGRRVARGMLIIRWTGEQPPKLSGID